MSQKPWAPSRRLVISVLLACAAALALYRILQPHAPSEIRKANLNHLSASGLFDRYLENEGAANAHWGDGTHRLAVTGTVADVDGRDNEVWVELRHERRPEIAARAFLVRGSWARGIRLQPGIRATVRCERATWVKDGPVLLMGCQL